jgi:hypothetical protein
LSEGIILFITGKEAVPGDSCPLQTGRDRKIKKKARAHPLPDLIAVKTYSAEIASVGQEATQEPQSRHFSGSIQCFPSFSEIASTGQSLTQEPQFTQASLIL